MHHRSHGHALSLNVIGYMVTHMVHELLAATITLPHGHKHGHGSAAPISPTNIPSERPHGTCALIDVLASSFLDTHVACACT